MVVLDSIMFTVILCSVVFGAALTLLLQVFLLRRWFSRLPALGPPYQPQHSSFTLPQELADAIKDSELQNQKESCTCLNLIFQFLFKELRDTRHVRGWVMRRMNAEFAEMLQTTTGRLLDKITVRDFNLGHTFPIVQNVSVQSVVTKDESHDIDELALLVDLTYHGGFQLAVDVDLVFGKSAFLSVKVTNLKGTARLQFTRLPYTHWSFSFIEDPTMDFEVESQFEGRPISQLTSLIVNSIRRSVRKKHTLPFYKVRYKPFFMKTEPQPPTQDIYIHGSKLSTGQLSVNILACSRLVKLAPDSLVFCTLAIDSLPWTEMVSSRKKLWVAHDIEICRSTNSVPIGITFREEFIHEKYEELVVIDSVVPGSPAGLADIRKNDIVLSVGPTKVSSSKHAVKLMKQVTNRFTLRVERVTTMKGGQDYRFEEDTVSLRDSDVMDPGSCGRRSDEEIDDYVNITITPIDQSDKGSTKSMPIPVSSSLSSLTDERIPSASPKKGFSILSSSPGLFLRKRNNKNSEGGPQASPELRRQSRVEKRSSPQGSPELGFKMDNKRPVDGEGGTGGNKKQPLQRRRSKSDVGLAVSDKQPEKADDNSSGENNEGENNTAPQPSQPLAGSEDQDDDSIDLRKTSLIKATQDPVFQEVFEFEVEDCHNYLNLCVWCKIPEKLDKQNRVIKPEKDILVGHVSIQLMDIALECLATLQGDAQRTYQLIPAELKAVASRTKAANLASHSGFDEKLCYGDITLAYVHKTVPLTNTERRRVEKISLENEMKVQKELYKNNAGHRMPVEEGKHDFMGKHFQSATYCNFCLKKIWLKVAFQCRVCGMICHKKCTEKCQAQTKCSREGFVLKPPSLTGKTEENKEKENKEAVSGTPAVTAGASGGGPTQKSSFLSKFRKDTLATKLPNKDMNKGDNAKPSTSSMLDVPYVRRRRNSAPDREDSSESVEDGSGGGMRGLLTVSSLPRTRSTTSLQDMMLDNTKPTLSIDDNKSLADTDTSSPYSSDSDDELNLLKFFEQQKSSQNADEVVVTAAKEMGKELFAHLDPEERRDKLDSTVNKLQSEIDKESVNRAELARMERQTTDSKQRDMILNRIEKSDEKIQSLALLMLHYCAGLQHCLDQQEAERQRETAEPSQEELQPSDGTIAMANVSVPVVIGEDAVEMAQLMDKDILVKEDSNDNNSETEVLGGDTDI